MARNPGKGVFAFFAVAVILAALAPYASGSTVGTWTQGSIVDRGTHTISRSHTGVVIPDYSATSMFIVGGTDSTSVATNLATLHRYDHPGGNLTSLTSIISGAERTEHCAVAFGSQMFVFGGLQSVTALDDMYVYTPSTNSWAGSTTFPGTGRYGHACAVLSGSMYVFGGLDPSGNPLAETLRYEFGTTTWTTLSPAGTAPSARHDLTLTAVGDCLYAIGGGDSSSGSPHTSHSDVHRFCPSDGAQGTWTPLSPSGTPPVRRYGHGAVARGTRVVVQGGYAGVGSGLFPNDMFSDILVYDTVTNAWHTPTINAPLPSARHDASLAIVGNDTVLFGGKTASSIVGDLWYTDYAPLECPAGEGSPDGITACAPCEPGTEAPSSGTYNCTACAGGSFAPGNGTTSCTLCPAGFFGNVTGATAEAEACFPCGAGTYLAAGPPARGGGEAECVPCPATTFGNATGAEACTTCPEGYYTSGTGEQGCTICPQGSFCTGGAIAPCPASTFQGAQGRSECDPCPAASYSSGGATLCTDCGPGTFATVNGTSSAICEQCPQGQYSSASGVTSCTDCPAGSWSDQLGNDNVGDCTLCAAGTSSVALGATSVATCVDCLAGSYSEPPGGRSACTLCGPGTYNPNNASVNPLDCVSCPAGSSSTVSGASSAASCSSCPVGTYSTSGSCTACPAGTFSTTIGATAATACVPCPHNSISAAGSEQCFECDPGTVAVSGSSYCETCATDTSAQFAAPDEMLPGASMDSTFAGADGWVATAGVAAASGVGVVLPGRSDAVHAVSLTRASAADPVVSLERAAGAIAAPTGATYAVSAYVLADLASSAEDADWVLRVRAVSGGGAATWETTVQLPVSTDGAWVLRRGFIYNEDTLDSLTVSVELGGVHTGTAWVDQVSLRPTTSVACACDPGYHHEDLDMTLCQYCTLGSECVLSTSIACGAGEYSMGGNTRCVDCLPGRWCSSGRMNECELGQYPTDPTASSCTACPAGSECPNGVLASCEAGRFSEGGSHRCFECPEGTFQASSGQSSCDPCPAGTFSGAMTTTACTPCPAGHFSEIGSTACSSCAAGSYAASTSSGSCDPCPAGSYSPGPASSFCTTCPGGTTTAGTGASKKSQCV